MKSALLVILAFVAVLPVVTWHMLLPRAYAVETIHFDQITLAASPIPEKKAVAAVEEKVLVPFTASEVADLVNAYRASRGVAPLQRKDDLWRVAYWRGQYVALSGKFSHEASGEMDYAHWMGNLNYPAGTYVGENLAVAQTSAEEVVQMWIDSPAHNANLLDPRFTDIGVSAEPIAYEGFDNVMLTVLFLAANHD